MKAFLHWISHLFQLNTGHVVTAYDETGVLWVGFKCDGCGLVQGAHYRDELQ